MHHPALDPAQGGDDVLDDWETAALDDFKPLLAALPATGSAGVGGGQEASRDGHGSTNGKTSSQEEADERLWAAGACLEASPLPASQGKDVRGAFGAAGRVWGSGSGWDADERGQREGSGQSGDDGEGGTSSSGAPCGGGRIDMHALQCRATLH
jgi:hypothetical protein